MPMYGDLMHSVFVPCILPFFIAKLLDDNECPTVATVTITLLWVSSGCLTLTSWFTNRPRISFLAALLLLAFNLFVHITGWPEPDGEIILPSFVAPFIISVLNTETSVYQKSLLGAINLISTYVSMRFPTNQMRLRDGQLPLLGVGFLATNLWIFLVPDLSHPRVPRILLILWCAYEIFDELSRATKDSGYTPDFSRLAKTLFPIASTLAALTLLQRKMKELKKVGGALDACKTPVGVIDEASHIIWVNPALELLFSGEELIGRPLYEIVGYKKPIKSNSVGDIEDTIIELIEATIGGLHFRIEISNAKAPARGGSMVVFRDITEEKKREQAQLDATREKLKQEAMMRSVEQLGHELRTPLQSILSTGTLLQDKAKDLGEEIDEMAGTILASGQHLLLLIENASALPEWSKNEEVKIDIQSTPLEPIWDNIIAICEPLAFISGVTIDPPRRASESDFHVLANASRLQLIMTNFLCNSISSSSRGANVAMEVEALGGECIQKRWDSATKILTSRSDLSRSCEKDFVVVSFTQHRVRSTLPTNQDGRVHGSNESLKTSFLQTPTGSEIGFSTSVKLLEAMRGSMWVKNIGRSSILSFLLPRCEPVQRKVHRETPSKSELASLLVVDDTLVNLKLMARVLKRGGIPDVATAASGPEALRLLEKRLFDVILSDYHMPGMNGDELGSTILSKNLSRQPLLICISAGFTDEMKSACNSAGIFHVLQKPLTPNLVSRIHNLWRDYQPPSKVS